MNFVVALFIRAMIYPMMIQIDSIPLSVGAARPTQGKALAMIEALGLLR